jgi:hypothetical protein
VEVLLRKNIIPTFEESSLGGIFIQGISKVGERGVNWAGVS